MHTKTAHSNFNLIYKLNGDFFWIKEFIAENDESVVWSLFGFVSR